jgi:DNA topoisomerase-2
MKFKKISTKDYLSYFADDYEYIETDDYIISVFHSPTDDFQFFTYTNGIYLKKGGNHIDLIIREISTRMKDKLVKKYKTIKPGDIKNQLSIVVMFKNFKNIEVDAQTKETLENHERQIREYLNLDWDKFVSKLMKNKSILNPIIDIFKAKEMVKTKAMMSKIKKKKVISDKYWKSTNKNKYLLCVEGLSALGGISAGLGRDEYSYYALKGKLLNCMTNSPQKILANQEIQELINIIENDKPEYILSTTDADLDGSHILALLIVFISKYYPEYIENGKFGRFRTPVIVYFDKNHNITHTFYTMEDHQQLKEKPKGTMKYLKGLGSLWDGAIDQIIEIDGLDSMIEIMTLEDVNILESWMGGTEYVDYRKQKIQENEFNILML